MDRWGRERNGVAVRECRGQECTGEARTGMEWRGSNGVERTGMYR